MDQAEQHPIVTCHRKNVDGNTLPIRGTPNAKEEKRRRIGWKPVALDGGYGWVVVLGSFLIHVFADGFVYSFGVIAESLIKEFNASNTQVSTVLSLLTGLMLATGPLASAICNRIGCRTTTIIGAVVAAVGCFASYFATSMHFLIATVGIVMGLGFGLMYCPAIVIVTIYFEKRRSLATGITVCGAGVGTFVFSNVIGWMVAHFGWRQVFLIYAGLVLLCVPCGALYRPIQFRPIYEGEEDGEGDEVEEYVDGGTDLVHPANGALPSSTDKLLLDNPSNHDGAVPDEMELAPSPPPSRRNSRGGLLRMSDRRHQRGHHPLRSAHSSQVLSPGASGRSVVGGPALHDTNRGPSGAAGGVLQRFRSLGEHLHLRSCGLPANPNQEAAQAEVNTTGEGAGGVSVSTGYLNVKDVFYRRSIMDLPEYVGNEQRFRSISSLGQGGPQPHGRFATAAEKDPTKSLIARSSNKLTASATHLHVVVDKIEEREEELLDEEEGVGPASLAKRLESDDGDEDEEEDSGATSASRAIEVWRTIKRMMDLALLADPIYLLFAVSNFFTSIGFNAPPMFMPMNAEKVIGAGVEEASWTVAAYGLANTFGRIAFGVICDRHLPTKWGKDKARNRLWIYNLALMLCGVASCFVFTIEGLGVFISYCFFFGFTISSYVCLTSVVLVDLIGVDRLTNAFGLLLFIQGIATFVGPPMAASFYDLTKRYSWTFTFCGVCLFVSGAMLFAIPHLQQRRNGSRRYGDKKLSSNGGVLLAHRDYHDEDLEEPARVKKVLPEHALP